MRVAMIGQRGVPATYGGIEHHVEQLGQRLAARGHQVTVFCRTNYAAGRQPMHRGMRLCHLPTIGSKHFDAFAHSGLCTLVALKEHYDIIHYHALGPGLWSPLPKCFSRARVVQTIHGLDQRRAKWNRAAKAVLTSGAWVSGHVPDATIVVSQALAAYYRSRYGRAAVHIANGVETPACQPRPDEIAARWGLTEGGYILFVGRLVPEKAPDLLIRAFQRLNGDIRLVVAGDSSFTDGYTNSLRHQAADDRRVLFTGYVYGPTLAELYANAAAFVLPSAVEGMPLTLLEAASYGTPVIASDLEPHAEVLGRDAPGRRMFPAGDEEALVCALEDCLEDPFPERAGAAALRQDVLRRYRWDDAADFTERVYLDLLNGSMGV